MELNRVVVTGLGALTPLGNSVEETWKNILEGKSGAAPITLFDPSKFRTQFACEVKGFKAADYIDRKDARLASRRLFRLWPTQRLTWTQLTRTALALSMALASAAYRLSRRR